MLDEHLVDDTEDSDNFSDRFGILDASDLHPVVMVIAW